jgi:D-glycero-D-manno-heptose 1,7-bisphosphate phosphatase
MTLLSLKSNRNPRRAVFLDRDGIINRKLPENHYVSKPSEFELLPDVEAALAIMRDHGFVLVVVTNQRGIARGIMTEHDLIQVHQFMNSLLIKYGVKFEGIYYCPHDKNDYCDCRKPEPGMILAAAKDLEIDLNSSYMVGDSASDVEAAKNAGVKSVHISSAGGDIGAELVFPTLIDFARHLDELERSLSQPDV